MATAADHLSDPELLETGWDLRPLLDGEPADGSDDPEDRARRLLDEATGLAEGFAAHYAGKVAKWWIPDDVLFVKELPHTATGKLLKTRLRELYADTYLRTPAAIS